MALITGIDAGILQQKLYLGYEFRVAKYTPYANEKVQRQIFLGVGLGLQNYNSFYFTLAPPDFVLHAKGYNMSFSITNAAIKLRGRNQKQYNYNFLTLRVGVNRFNKVSAYYRNYNNNGWTGSNDGVYDPKCNSVDLEFMFIKLVKLNSNNYLRLGINAGIRSGEVTGIRYHHNLVDPNSNRFSESLSPVILNLNLGYQFHFGPTSKIERNKNN